jgi:alkylhydroperoxidase family enzyme
VSSELGVSDEKILALESYATSALYSDRERLCLEYADGMTITGREVDDALFARLRAAFDDDTLVELTAIIAWENSSSKFNRAMRVPSQGLWQGSTPLGGLGSAT